MFQLGLLVVHAGKGDGEGGEVGLHLRKSTSQFNLRQCCISSVRALDTIQKFNGSLASHNSKGWPSA